MIKKSVIFFGKSYFKTKNKKILEKNKIKKILFIKSGAIGDVLMTTPLIRAVKTEFPNAKIVYCTGNWSKDVLKNNKNIDKIVSFDEKIIFKKKIFELRKLAKNLAGENFDLCFVLDWSYMAGLFASMCAPKAIRIGFDRNGEGFAHSILVPYGDKKHDSEYYLDLAKAIGIKNVNNLKMKLPLIKRDIEFANAFFKKNNIKSKVIGIAPGGAHNPGQTMPLKRWSREKYIELCEMIFKKTKANIVFIGGKDDVKHIESIIKDIKTRVNNNNRMLSTAGKADIIENAAIIKKCSVFVTNDSGPMHIAAAIDTPVISIFGPTNPIKLAPLGKKHKYFWSKEKCAPCYKNGSFTKCINRTCMNKIKSETIFNEIKKRLK